MKTAYKEEIETARLEMESSKIGLENWYAKRYPEDDIKDTTKDP